MKILGHSTQAGLENETHRVSIQSNRRSAEGRHEQELGGGRNRGDRHTKPRFHQFLKTKTWLKVQIRQSRHEHQRGREPPQSRKKRRWTLEPERLPAMDEGAETGEVTGERGDRRMGWAPGPERPPTRKPGSPSRQARECCPHGLI
jgi:hypothetical protein